MILSSAGANIIVWGAILMLHASTTSFHAFFALRFLLGMCECCVAPILILITSMFYKKDEQVSTIYVDIITCSQSFIGCTSVLVLRDGRLPSL